MLVDSGLVDYVAMDIKNAPEKYAETAGVAPEALSGVQASVSFCCPDVWTTNFARQ